MRKPKIAKRPPAEVVTLFGGKVIGSPANPDAETIEELERLLTLAKDGQITGFAIATHYFDGTSHNRYVGACNRATVGSLMSVMGRMTRSIDGD